MKTKYPLLASVFFFILLVLWTGGSVDTLVVALTGFLTSLLWFLWFVRGDWG
jgi:hypothetical protein